MNLPACLIIMDGYGIAPEGEGNAISIANTPRIDELLKSCPNTTIQASGTYVGLPDGQMGNSEVGHLNIGAGRVVFQELTRIDNACDDGSIATQPAIQKAFEHASENGSVLHLMGLLSDGGVHSSNKHLYALIDSAIRAGVTNVHVHCFLDGRDVPPKSGVKYVAELQEFINSEIESFSDKPLDIRISTLTGRYYAMDRDNRWERVERAFDAIVSPTISDERNPIEILEASYDSEVTDEFVEPTSLDGAGIKDGDSVIFFNFRPDRARELTRAIVEDDFDGFSRSSKPDVYFVCLTEYDPLIHAPIAFPKEFPNNVLADVLSDAGLDQYHIAETEKYAHVTFFLNGGIEAPKLGEERVMIASPKVATYDLQPEMSEPEVATTLAEAIRSDKADVYIINFANCDMVGHTGVIPAAVKAVEAVDAGVGAVLDAIAEKGGIALVTADHGNADKMLDETGGPHTAHTTAPVPLILFNASGESMSLTQEQGALCDIAPTLLEMIGLEKPTEMTGKSLLAKK